MVSDNNQQQQRVLPNKIVLILVLMEDGLWLTLTAAYVLGLVLVLILVLMEDGLWHPRGYAYRSKKSVLILVLMEDGLWLQ